MIERKPIHEMISVFILASCLAAVFKPWPREVKSKQEESTSLSGRNKSGPKEVEYLERVRKKPLRKLVTNYPYCTSGQILSCSYQRQKIYVVVKRTGPGIVGWLRFRSSQDAGRGCSPDHRGQIESPEHWAFS